MSDYLGMDEFRDPMPCRCLRSHAYISPTHLGHCCFLPADATCHEAEVAEWERSAGRLPPNTRQENDRA